MPKSVTRRTADRSSGAQVRTASRRAARYNTAVTARADLVTNTGTIPLRIPRAIDIIRVAERTARKGIDRAIDRARERDTVARRVRARIIGPASGTSATDPRIAITTMMTSIRITVRVVAIRSTGRAAATLIGATIAEHVV